MKSWINTCSLIALLGAAPFLSATLHAELAVGDSAPDFELPGSDGKTYRLADFKDKEVVVLAWFPKAFTGGCTAECKSLKENNDALGKYKAAWFTASVDTAEDNKRFAESLELNYPILSDPDKKVATAYGVVSGERGLPARWTFYIGKDGKILRIDKAVKAGEAGADVAKTLEELGVEKRD
ncbi:MAG TPA: peroxiredoxin [Verrucomicrobiales bacterium]|nr:peroxiredoxin [Verrucomicrobiales bacterium]